MFRVLDDRPGSNAALSVASPGPLRVCAHVPPSAEAADLTWLRVLLIADLLARAAELGGLQVLTTWAFPPEPAGEALMGRAAAALGVHPPVLTAADPAAAWSSGAVDVHVADEDAASHADGSRIMIRAATARLAPDASPDDAAEGVLGGHDPLAIRLALMSFPRHQPAVLTADGLLDAAQTLGRWRRQVAGWAESPSRPIPEQIAVTFRAAFDNLDAVAALAALSGLAADDTVPAGTRFETFVYADRVLGVDLARDIGR